MKTPLLVTVASTLVLVACPPLSLGDEVADAIYHNGPILTVNDAQPTAEAVAVKDGKVFAVGTDDKVLETKGENTTLIDLGGKTMLPGFVDSHGLSLMLRAIECASGGK